jgi:cell division septation protein DedD
VNQTQQIFIFTRREILILVTLGVMLGLFAFTLGVHLGKKVGVSEHISEAQVVSTVTSVPDRLPSSNEFHVHSKTVETNVDGLLSEELQAEVKKTGIHIDQPRQMHLPKNTVSANAGATTPLSHLKKEIKFTLQIGSFPSVDEAAHAMHNYKKSDLHPFLKEVKVKGKGKWYRVYLGEFPSQEEADSAGKKYKAQKLVPSYVVSRVPS